MAPHRHRFLVPLLLSAAVLASTGAVSAKTGIAVTIDDLPFVGGIGPDDTRLAATRRILSVLAKRRVPATGFVVCRRVTPKTPIIRAWVDAGLQLGNHSTTHPHIDDLSNEAWESDVRGCRDRLKSVTGRRPVWFRFPYLQTGRTPKKRAGARRILKRLGHRMAHVSIDTGEWVLVAPYVAALKAGDQTLARSIGRAWVDHVLAAVRRYRQLARERVGREIGHVLLLHANALAADYLGELLDAVAAMGLPFVPLDAAMKDPVYARRDGYSGTTGLSWLYRFEPAMTGAWAWDSGQVETFRRRFGRKKGSRSKYRIDEDLVVRPIRPKAWVITHTNPWPANSLLVEMADSTLVLVDTPYTPDATRRLTTWLHARFGKRRAVADQSAAVSQTHVVPGCAREDVHDWTSLQPQMPP